jgi:hypothetical protein
LDKIFDLSGDKVLNKIMSSVNKLRNIH